MLVLVWFYAMMVYWMWCVLGKMLKLCVVVNPWFYAREHWRTLVFLPRRASLAQARASRVSPWSLCELSPRRRAPVLSKIHLAQARRTRLSERMWMLLVPLFELSPRRRELAWARETSRLSEELGKKCVCSVVSLFLDVGYMFGLNIHF